MLGPMSPPSVMRLVGGYYSTFFVSCAVRWWYRLKREMVLKYVKKNQPDIHNTIQIQPNIDMVISTYPTS